MPVLGLPLGIAYWKSRPIVEERRCVDSIAFHPTISSRPTGKRLLRSYRTAVSQKSCTSALLVRPVRHTDGNCYPAVIGTGVVEGRGCFYRYLGGALEDGVLAEYEMMNTLPSSPVSKF